MPGPGPAATLPCAATSQMRGFLGPAEPPAAAAGRAALGCPAPDGCDPPTATHSHARCSNRQFTSDVRPQTGSAVGY